MTAPTALLEPEVAPPNTVLFRGLTIDEIAAYEARLEALTLEAMRRVMRQVTRNLGHTTTAALVAAVDPAGISPDDLAGIIPLWQTQLDEQLLPVVAEIYRDSSGALTAQMLETAANPPPVSSAAAEAYLARSRAQFAEVGGELWEQARNQLLDGMSAGESVPQIADRLRTTTPALTNRTASLIARTQVNDAANAGSFDTARVSGLDLLKGWESTADLRTRETHLMAGSTYSGPGMIGLDDPFMVGGFPCLRPHDLSLPPEERYNCRCTLIYRMRGDELSASEQAIRDIEAEHVARIAALQAQHNQELDQLLAQHAQRVAALEQQHAVRTAAIEARYQAKLAQIQQSADTATVVAQSIAKAKAAHQLRLAQWDADYQLRTAKRTAEYEQRVLLRNTYFDQRRAVLDAEYQHRLAIARGQTPGLLPSAPGPVAPLPAVPVAGQPTSVPIRASLLQATTVPEVRKAFIFEWQRIVRENPGAIRGAARFLADGDVQTAREHAEGLLRAIERFPHTRLDVTYGSMTHYAETTGRVASFASEYARARDDYLLSLRLSGATGPDGTAYHPITISSPQGIALHEFGHALQYGLAFDPQGVYDYALYVQVNRRVRKLVQELANERGVSADDLIRTEIGGYAQEGGTGELVAEAFADVMVNGEQASALSQRIFALLVNDYERLAGRQGLVQAPGLGPGALPSKAVPKPELGIRPMSATKFAQLARQAQQGSRAFDEIPIGKGWHTLEETRASIRGELGVFRGLDALPNGPEVEKALRRYMDTRRYLQINAGLRREAHGGRAMSAAARRDVALIDEALDSSRLTDDILVWRGPGTEVFGGSTGALPQDLAGFTWTDAGFVSTSTSRNYVLSTFGGYRPVLRIVVPKGSKAIQLSGTLDESEILLGRNLTFRVVKDYGDAEIPGFSSLDFPTGIRARLMDVEVISSEAAAPISAEGRMIAEILQAIEHGADLDKVVEGLAGRAEMKEILALINRTPDRNNLATNLRALAARRGFTVPTTPQLRAMQAVERKAAAAAKREAAIAARAEKARQLEIKRQVKAVEGGDFSSLVRVGPQAGGNPGGVFEDASGQRWYVKQYRNEEQGRGEALALAFYRAAGIDAPDMVVGSGAPDIAGKGVQVATRILPDAKTDLLDRLANDPAYIAKVREGFALDAWLANWDVVGLDAGNIVSSAGVPWRIDAGGALRYRALGESKGAAFGDNVVEWLTLRDPARARQASQIFAGMTHKQLLDAVARVKKLTPARIQTMARRYGLDEKLAARLIARRADLLDQATRELDLAGNYKLMLRTAKRGKAALDETPVRIVYPGRTLTGVDDPTGDVAHALVGYRMHGYERINGVLRGGSRKSPPPGSPLWKVTVRDIRAIDRALDQSPLRSDVLVYRGLRTGKSVFGERSKWGNLAGFEWREPGYVSSSASRTKVVEFATGGYSEGRGVIMRLISPKGINAVQLSDLGHEGELMFDRGLLFRVVRDYGDDEHGVRILDVEVISRVTPRSPVT